MTTPPRDRCRRLRERVSRYLDGELPPAERRAVAAHLRRCPCCRTMADGLRHTVELCREAGTARLPSEVSRRARARVSMLLAGGKKPSSGT
jgi:anti-sigma factor RsiW